MEQDILCKDSGKKWNTTVIMVWVHWNEFSGVQALENIMDSIKVSNWKVYFIYGNPKALELNKRYYEKNLNRCFVKWNNGTYEDKRAKKIMKILDKSDYLLDVHNTINENNSIPFLISEYQEYSKFFDVKYVVSWFDKLHPWWSDGYMNRIWKKWFCIECGSIFGNKQATINLAEKSIINFLKLTKNIDWEAEITKFRQKNIKFDFIYKNETLDFKFVKNFKDFEFLKKWDIIWYDGEKKIEAVKDCFILFPYLPWNISDECFCIGKSI